MANKNKVTLIGALNMFILFMLLNSCQTDGNGYNRMKQKDNSHTNDTYTNDFKLSINNKQQSECPVCRGGSRYLYKLTNGEIVLTCKECDAIWLNPRDLSWNGVTNDKVLQEEFSVKDVEDIFDEPAGWATKKEVQNSKWWQLVQNNELLVK